MRKALTQAVDRHRVLSDRLLDPAVLADHRETQKAAKERAELEEVVGCSAELARLERAIADDEAVLRGNDGELADLARTELPGLRTDLEKLEGRIRELLLPKDPYDSKNVIVEIRAGTGGDEAALFAAELYRMYTKYAEKLGYSVEVLSTSGASGIGGLKEVIFQVNGPDAYSRLKFESGVHRVQRVPVTEASGRIHTSAVTVAVLPEAEDVDVEIRPEDLEVDVFRAGGPGGQGVNTTDSAVRVRHIPSGMVVTCQDERSQIKNRGKAIKVLKARLLDRMQREQEEKQARERRSQVSTGDRSAKIRTYNFPQGRVTDHRIALTVYRLQDVLEGELGEFTGALRAADVQARLQGRTLAEVKAGAEE
ncbi:MAG TPA: peptide chain release factor 1 [Candidatus Saccharimonadales bacterium]|nr:peptide chain release factor 1 [Candidatus Saccharimonadales bacterium]